MQMDRIEIDPRVCSGKPVIKGTRSPVAVLVDQLAEGESWSKLLMGYPELSSAFFAPPLSRAILRASRHRRNAT